MSWASITQISWRDLATVGSLVFGFVTLLAYLEQRRSSRQMASLAKLAARTVDRALAEETIQSLTDRKAALEEEVSKKIPALARAAVLQEQVKIHERAIAEHVVAWQSASKELESSANLPLDLEVMQAIVDRIVPRYMRQERRDRFRTRVIVLCVILAVFSSILPSPLNIAFGLLMALPLSYTAMRLYVLNEEPADAFKVLRPWCYGFCAALAALLVVGGIVVSISKAPTGVHYAAIAAVVGGAALAAVFLTRRRWIDNCVHGLCGTRALSSIGTRIAESGGGPRA